ncbi:AfsR/SARP family transcriptional regulator, partial [Actinocorallia lasiicapitis]
MKIAMLGALEITDGAGTAVPLGGARLRALLIALALEPGRLVPAESLIDGIWGEEPPVAAANALQAIVSRLRRALRGVEIETRPAGYLLHVAPEAVDVARFEALVATGRAALPSDPA